MEKNLQELPPNTLPPDAQIIIRPEQFAELKSLTEFPKPKIMPVFGCMARRKYTEKYLEGKLTLGL